MKNKMLDVRDNALYEFASVQRSTVSDYSKGITSKYPDHAFFLEA